jgi:hypothetical protein
MAKQHPPLLQSSNLLLLSLWFVGGTAVSCPKISQIYKTCMVGVLCVGYKAISKEKKQYRIQFKNSKILCKIRRFFESTTTRQLFEEAIKKSENLRDICTS